MAVITLKCSDQEKEAFENLCDQEGVTLSEKLRYLMNQASDHTPEKIDVHSLHERLKALEAKFKSLPGEAPKKTPAPRKDYSDDDLLTKQDVADLTGYAYGSLSGKFSREGIKAVKRIDGNRGGLYSKEEILEKIGSK